MKRLVLALLLACLFSIADEEKHSPDPTPTPTPTPTPEAGATPTPHVLNEEEREQMLKLLEVSKNERDTLQARVKEVEPQESPNEEAIEALYKSIPEQLKTEDPEGLFNLIDLKNEGARKLIQARLDEESKKEKAKTPTITPTEPTGKSFQPRSMDRPQPKRDPIRDAELKAEYAKLQDSLFSTLAMGQKGLTPQIAKDIDRMTEIYASLLHADNRESYSRQTPTIPRALGSFQNNIRSLTGVSKGGDLEHLFYEGLSKHLADYGKGITDEQIAQGLLDNVSTWQDRELGPDIVPNVTDRKDLIRSSFDFAKQTVDLMGMVNALRLKEKTGGVASETERGELQKAVKSWAQNEFIKRERNLTFELNAFPYWGKTLTIESLNKIEQSKDLAATLEKALPEGGITVLREKLQESLYTDVKRALGDAEQRRGIGGSVWNTSLAVSAFEQLSKERQKELLPVLKSGLENRNNNPEGVTPYFPYRGYEANETPANTAGRNLTWKGAKFAAEPTKENALETLDALEQFSTMYGLYYAHTNRPGAHDGPDEIGNYYGPKGMHAAGRAISKMEEYQDEVLTQEGKQRLAASRQRLTDLARASFIPEHGTFTPTGNTDSLRSYPTPLLASFLEATHRSEPKTREAPPKEELKADERDIAPPSHDEDKEKPKPKRVEFAGDLKEVAKNFAEALTQDPKSADELMKELEKEKDPIRHQTLQAAAWATIDKAALSSKNVEELVQWSLDEGNPVRREYANRALLKEQAKPENAFWQAHHAETRFEGLGANDTLQDAVRRREALAEGNAEEKTRLARHLAQGRLSLNDEKLAAMEKRVSALAEAKDPISKMARAVYGNDLKLLPEADRKIVGEAVAAASARAKEWTKNMKSLFDEEGNFSADKEIAPGVTAAQWVDEKRKEVGDTRFLAWSRNVGGEQGNRALQALLGRQDTQLIANRDLREIKKDDAVTLKRGSEVTDLAAVLDKSASKESDFRLGAPQAGARTAKVGENGFEFKEIAGPPTPEPERKRGLVSRGLGGPLLDDVDATADNLRKWAEDQRKPAATPPPLDPAEREQLEKSVKDYENTTYTNDDEVRYPFSRQNKDMFPDLDARGDGKVRISYRGPKDPELEARYKDDPIFEVKHYEDNTPEAQHMINHRKVGLVTDAMGRKIIRLDSLSSVPWVDGQERPRAKAYLEAKQKLHVEATPPPPPAKEKEEPSERPAHTADIPKDPHAWGHTTKQCTTCHGSGEKSFPDYVSDQEKFEKKLEKKDPEAQAWLKRLNTNVVHGRMLTEAGLNQSEEGRAFRETIRKQYEKYIGPQKEEPKAPAPAALWMIDPEKKDEYTKVLEAAMKLLPDPEIRKLVGNPDVIHDPKGAPPQTWAPHGGQSGMQGARALDYPPADPVAQALFDADGNWRAPFAARGGFAIGADTKGLEHFFMIRFPRDEKGNLVKGITGEEVRASTSASASFGNHPNENSIWASYPKGTTVMEVLYTKNLGAPTPVDILTREKEISDDGNSVNWRPNGFRMSRESLRDWAQGQTKGENVKRLLAALDSPQPDVIRSELGEARQGGAPFVVNGQRTGQITGTKSTVKGLDLEFLKKMYAEVPLEAAAGKKGWQLETSDVFSNSHRGIPINGKSCANCHNSAGENFVDVFERAGLGTMNVSAYGQMGGSDSVLSHNPFDRATLNEYPDTSALRRPPGMRIKKEMRSDFRQYFEKYDPTIHTNKIYRRTRPN